MVYKCNICLDTFKEKHEISNHNTTVHEGKKFTLNENFDLKCAWSIKCILCEDDFPSKPRIIQHGKEVHGLNPEKYDSFKKSDSHKEKLNQSSETISNTNYEEKVHDMTEITFEKRKNGWAPLPNSLEDIGSSISQDYNAIVLGLRDYVLKSNFQKVV